MMKSLPIIALAQILCISVFGQSFTSVGVGANAPVLSLVEFNGNLSAGGLFDEMNAFERINHCRIRENALDNYSFFSNYVSSFNTTSEGTTINHTKVNCAAWFNNRLHLGGQFYDPNFPEALSIGYFDTLSSEESTPFLPYEHQLNDTNEVYAFERYDQKLFFGGDFKNLNGANVVGYIEANDYPNPSVNSAGNNLHGVVYALENHRDTLYAGGNFSVSDSDTVIHVNLAFWTGQQWRPLGKGLNGPVYTLLTSEIGLLIGGAFTASDSMTINKIGLWANSYEPIGLGFPDSNDTVFALNVYGDSIYAGGRIGDTVDLPYRNIARWNESSWVGIGEVNGPIYSMTNHRGRMYLGGDFTKAHKTTSRYIIAYHNGIEPVSAPSAPSSGTNKVLVWPNPSTGVAQYRTSQSLKSISVFDISGMQVFSEPRPQNEGEVNLHSVIAGLYTMRFEQANGEISFQKVMIAP
ncbi:MAG: hypothetical protein Salg2KO_05350 [Salibacteraceae bacterium]